MWFLSILLSISYFLSRLPFLRAYPVYYDSFEYARVAETINFSNFTQTITSSHQPIHTFYFLTILIFKQIFFFLSAEKVLVLISLVFGYLTVVFFFLFVKEYLDDKKAFFASLLLLLFPYFFVANTNILYESELLFFQIAALYFFFTGLKKENIRRVLLAGIFWSISISIFTGSLIIFPVFAALYLKIKKKLSFLSLALILIPALLTPLFLDILIFKSPAIIASKYQLHFSDLVSTGGGLFVFGYRILRNIVLESSTILSPAGIIVLAIIIVIYSLTTHYSLLTTLLWFLPPLFLMQFWHAGLFGRLAIFLVFPASLLLTESLTKNWQKIFLLFTFLVFLVPLLIAQTKNPPIYRFYDLIKNVPNVAILTSDSNRFLYQKYELPIFVFSPGNDLPEAEKFINENLKQGKTVLIDSAGLNYPYFQFDGDSYHLLSRHPQSIPHCQSLLEKFQTETFKSDPKNKEIYFEKIQNKINH